MLIGVRKRFVFVANTKTASTSIERALMDHAEIHRSDTPVRKHIALADILRDYDFLFGQPGHAPESYFRFGVMRDPLDWIGSWFRYRKGNRVEAPLPQEMSFAAFWARKDWNILRPDGRRMLQRDQFCAPDGTVLADVIIPYHDLEAHFAAICGALGADRPLPRENVSRRHAIGEDIPEDLRAEIRAFYAEDYALFDRLDAINVRGMEKLAARRDGQNGANAPVPGVARGAGPAYRAPHVSPHRPPAMDTADDKIRAFEAKCPMPAAEMRRLEQRKWVLELLEKGGVGAEIGVFRGHFSELICAIARPRKLYLVDPWTRIGETFGWGRAYTGFDTLTTADARAEAEARVSRHPGTETALIEGYYPDCADRIGEPLDFAYLDAGHSYDGTLAELRGLDRQVRPGGMILGDDWNPAPGAKHAGVFRAVNTFVKESDWLIVRAGAGGQWALRRG